MPDDTTICEACGARIRLCEQCGERPAAAGDDLCGRCREDHDGNLAAHVALYGEDDLGLYQPEDVEPDSVEARDGVTGYWDGDGWHWYSDEGY